MAGGGGGEEGDFGFQIAPMVDVVFVLLLFFMACAGQNIHEGYLEIFLPSGQEASDANQIRTTILVDIDAQGNVFVNSQPKSSAKDDKDLAQLVGFLKSSVETSPDDPVIIRPALDTRHERVIDVLNACRVAKVKNLSFG